MAKPQPTITIGLSVDELDWLITADRAAMEDMLASGEDASRQYPGCSQRLTNKMLAARTALHRKNASAATCQTASMPSTTSACETKCRTK